MPNHIVTNITAPVEVLEAFLVEVPISEKVEALNTFARRIQKWIQAAQTDPEFQLSDPQVDYYRSKLNFLTHRASFVKLVPPPDNLEEGGCTGIHPEGVECWYTWKINNWGTKWDAYASQYIGPEETGIEGWGILQFQTAWSFPTPVLDALISKFPESHFHVEYADEDLGYNVGEFLVDEGEAIFTDLSETEEGKDLAAYLHWGMPYGEVYEDA